MLKHKPHCYDSSHLKQFLHEQLDEHDESVVMLHIDSCDVCQKALENIAAQGSDWDAARQQLTDHLTQDHPGFDIREETIGLDNRDRDMEMERLQEYMGPTDNPDMLGRLGSYEVCGLVGRGSTGVVVKAHDPRLNRFVAIKVLSPSFASNGSARTRFEREGQAIAAVSHEHVVPVFGVDEYRGLPYIVMQYVSGGSLHQRINKTGPLETCEVVRLGMQIANGLAAAHAQGIVHRDVKPANVMLENSVDRAMVTDFGLARVADEAAMTRSGVIAGTPQYMSPEQARGEAIDPRSDLFSLGSVMYTACTGRPPFRSESLFGVIKRVCDSNPRSVREINPRIDKWLESFINRLHEKDREERFDSAQQVAEVLGNELAFLNSPSFVAQPERLWMKVPAAKPQEKPHADSKSSAAKTGNGWKLAIAATLLALLASAIGYGSGLMSKDNQNPTSGSMAGITKLDAKESQLNVLDLAGNDNNSEQDNDDLKKPKNKKPGSSNGGLAVDDSESSSSELTATEPATVGVAGKIVAVHRNLPGEIVDGFGLYLPASYDETTKNYPVIMFLSGGCGVGCDLDDFGCYSGMLDLIDCEECSDCESDCEDCESNCDDECESKLDEKTRAYLLDTFIIIAPHMIDGEFDERQFYDQESAIKQILNEVKQTYRTDHRKVYLTGAGRGGHGAWGLASRMPNHFAAVAPLRGENTGVSDYQSLSKMPIWAGHHQDDEDVDYSHTADAVEHVEEHSSEDFYVINVLDPTQTEFMDHDYILTSIEEDCSICWPNIYQYSAFYEWLLKYEISSEAMALAAAEPVEEIEIENSNEDSTQPDESADSELEWESDEDEESNDDRLAAVIASHKTQAMNELRVGNTVVIIGVPAKGGASPNEFVQDDDRPKFESNIEKVLDVAAGGTLVVRSEFGGIDVTTHDSNQVEVVVRRVIAAETQEAADELAKNYLVEFDLEEFELVPGKDAVISSRYSDEFKKSLKNNNYKNSPFRQVIFEIRLPNDFNLNIKTSAGDVSIPELTGNVDITTSGGDVTMESIDGLVDVSTSGGDIDLAGSNQSISLKTSGGDVTVGAVNGNAVIKTSGGDIAVSDVTGEAELITSGGDIELSDSAGIIHAHTSGGGISANLSVQPTSNMELRTSGGNMRIGLARNLKLNIDAHASVGQVTGPFVGNKNSKTVVKSLNGGGQILNARVSAGNIEFFYLDNN